MATLLLSFAIITISLLGLAAGVILGRQPLRGSCGGLSCDGHGRCQFCARKRPGGVE